MFSLKIKKKKTSKVNFLGKEISRKRGFLKFKVMSRILKSIEISKSQKYILIYFSSSLRFSLFS